MPLKQAVVLIHGVGEQVPMDTLRGFVRAVWTTNPGIIQPGKPTGVWSKPDEISQNYELRRLTTAENVRNQRTDFFEFYWADLMQDTELSHVWAWARVLLFRWPSRIPAQLRGLWCLLVLLGLAVVTAWLNSSFGWFAVPYEDTIKFGGGLLWAGLSWFLIHFAGDAARYLHVAPANIESRRKIRDAGIQLLENLEKSGKYDRIILVGHSLGTVIGYDILTLLWTKYNEKHATTAPAPALDALEAMVRNLPEDLRTLTPKEQDAFAQLYHGAQAARLAEMRSQQHPWLVSDFITMGSPLSHATVLMAANGRRLGEKFREREFPSCPPAMETVNNQRQCSYTTAAGARVPHHAAVFTTVRWTNLFFPCWATFWGDVIGGPVAKVFGPGVRDVPVRTLRGLGFFTHTAYWSLAPSFAPPSPPPPHIQELRAALKL